MSSSPHPGSPCPDALVLAAYLDQTLDAPARRIVEAHLVECETCREVTSAVIQYQAQHEPVGAPPLPVVEPAPPARPTVLKWVVATAAAAALAMAIAWPVNEWQRSSHRTAMQAALDGSTVGRWAILPRVSGSPYSQPQSFLRGAEDIRVPATVRVAAAQIEVALGESTVPADLALLGKARLLTGNLEGAIAALEQAASLSPQPLWQSDLAAAYLARASRRGNDAGVDKALAALRAAVAVDAAPEEAVFNLALALDAAGQPQEAARAWESYLQRYGTSPWATAARQQLQRLADAR